MMQMFYSILGLDSDSRSHFVPNQSSNSFNLIRMDTLSLGDEYVVVLLRSCFNSLKWSYLYYADDLFQFGVEIRILELIFVPNLSRDSFNLLRMDTLSQGDEYVVVPPEVVL